jgi:acetyl-CoA carboxylase biotin carboxyl carrier protein
VEIELIRSLAAHLSRSDLRELELRTGTTAIRLVRLAATRTSSATPTRGSPGSEGVAPVGAELCSPSVGTFIAEHPVTSEPFVKVGGQVNQGDVVGLIAYGNFIRVVEAGKTGRVSKVLVENGKPVGFGQKLFEIELRSEV